LRHRHQGIAPDIPGDILHGPFLLGLASTAELAVEQVVRPQAREAKVLVPLWTLEDPYYCRLGVVVDAFPRDPLKPPEGSDMALNECLQLLRRGCPGEHHPAGPHPHSEHVDCDSDYRR